MQTDNIVLRIRIRWGIIQPIGIAVFILLVINTITSMMLLFRHDKVLDLLILGSILPMAALAYIFYLPVKDIFGGEVLIISRKGLHLGKSFFGWSRIKSLSFNTNRKKEPFYRHNGLPVIQEMFILTTDLKEFRIIIDIDYVAKRNREKNNFILIRQTLMDMGKVNLLSDWAQKR